jgi:hypothetical protein
MKRTTIVANEEVLEKLRALARQRGVSFAEVVREAVEEKAGEYRPQPKSLGIGASGRSDVSSVAGVGRSPGSPWR